MRTTRSEARLGALVVCSCLLASGGVFARATALSFDDRVAAAKAIEQVYWAHRVWPEANRAPKPPFESVLPDAVLRAKVEAQLRMSARVESSMNRPPTGAELQGEIDRMARDTKAPDTLRELFAALHDDPFLVAECLARPALSARWAATEDADLSVHRAPGRSIVAVEPPAGGYTLPAILGGGCVNDTWALSTLTTATGANQPTARQLHTAVWTGAEMIVWGGWDGAATVYGNGGRYDPATDTWSLNLLTTGLGPNVPAARYRHTAIWTGTQMIVWGGRNAAGTVYNNGGGYDVASDTWVHSSLTDATGANIASARQLHTAVWTGTEMIVWGGAGASGNLNTGGKYDPAADTWAVTTLTTATTDPFTPAARIEHTAVWTGSEMIVWGGLGTSGAGLNNGGLYDPGTDTWSNSTLTGGTGGFTPSGRAFHSAIWTGSEMIVWGGAADAASAGVNTGGRYDPGTDAWMNSSLTNAIGAYFPTGRQRHTAVWTGSEMIVWGGSTDGGASVLQNGGRFAPATDSWGLTNLTNALGVNIPASRQFHSAVWTGGADHRMVVWGGSPNTATGGAYCAVCTALVWHADADGDGHGAAGATQVSCTQPAGYVASADDCDDTDPAIHPGATETCNGIDDDCNTVVDDGGGALCTDGDACSVDLCDPTTGCSAVHDTANFDVTGFSAARVDGRDLVIFATAWNSCPADPLYNAAANLDQGAAPPADCIDVSDFHLFMNVFGQSCP